jgi:hypothetical protein
MKILAGLAGWRAGGGGGGGNSSYDKKCELRYLFLFKEHNFTYFRFFLRTF